MERGRKPVWQSNIARERIDILLGLAEKELKKHADRSRRYVELARKIALRYNIRLTKEQKKKFCKNCNTLLAPGFTSQVRVGKNFIIIKCLKCDKLYRYRIK